MTKLFKYLGVLLLITASALSQTFPGASGNPSVLSRPGGTFYAPAFFGTGLRLLSGNSTTGSASVIIVGSTGGVGGVQLPDGTTVSLQTLFNTLTPMTFDWGQGASESVTPTAVSVGTCSAGNLGIGGSVQCATFTGSFNNTHGQNAVVVDSSFGLQTAINYAAQLGNQPASGTTASTYGGVVTVDSAWAQMGGTKTLLNAAVVYGNVSILDTTSGIPRYWNATPTGAALAVPTTLTSQAACDATHQFCSDANVAGSASYAGGTLFGCITYVDIMGNEGPCSLTASFTDVSTKAIDIASPAASTGAVGWIPYLSLDAGTYAQAYQIPPTSAVCTLSTLTPIPSCALANTTYGSVSSTFGANSVGQVFKGGAQITTYPVNTAQHFPKLASTIMTTASLTPVSNSSSTYAYAPSNRVGACNISSANVVNYAAAPSTTTAIPNAIATWTVPAGCFNYIGAEFRVSGKFTFTDGGDSSTEVRVAWDSAGTNSTTIPTKLCSIVDTATGTGAAYNGTYYCSVKTATTGATGTALVDGYANLKLAAGATTLVRDSTDVAVAPSASINLAAPGRIVVYFIGTGATNNPGAQGLAAKLEVLN